MFGSLASSLAGDVRVIRWDQRGCGRSERRGPYSVARSVADLDAVRACSSLGRTAVLGHSWGATLALRYALDHPDRVSALIYVAGTGLGWEWREPFQRAAAARLAAFEPLLSELRARDRSPAEDRELAILQWSADFTGADARRHAEEMATPWYGINRECYDSVWGELKLTWHEAPLIAECRALGVPVLIIDGAADLRPRWAVDSLERALPRVTRVVFPDVGHVPWLEVPGAFGSVVAEWLREASRLPVVASCATLRLTSIIVGRYRGNNEVLTHNDGIARVRCVMCNGGEAGVAGDARLRGDPLACGGGWPSGCWSGSGSRSSRSGGSWCCRGWSRRMWY
jgi:proline iminopeptidase